jgi:alpha/beta superfamily hydrolase
MLYLNFNYLKKYITILIKMIDYNKDNNNQDTLSFNIDEIKLIQKNININSSDNFFNEEMIILYQKINDFIKQYYKNK